VTPVPLRVSWTFLLSIVFFGPAESVAQQSVTGTVRADGIAAPTVRR